MCLMVALRVSIASSYQNIWHRPISINPIALRIKQATGWVHGLKVTQRTGLLTPSRRLRDNERNQSSPFCISCSTTPHRSLPTFTQHPLTPATNTHLVSDAWREAFTSGRARRDDAPARARLGSSHPMRPCHILLTRARSTLVESRRVVGSRGRSSACDVSVETYEYRRIGTTDLCSLVVPHPIGVIVESSLTIMADDVHLRYWV